MIKVDLSGKVAVITGASRGIGKAISEALATSGATAILLSRNESLLTEIQKELISKDAEALYYAVDVSNLKDMEKVFEKIRKQFKQIDILVNNAGVSPHYTSFHKTREEDWENIMNVNVRGTLIACKQAFFLMKDRGGSIVNISSIGGLVGLPRVAVYSASKGAILTFTKTLAAEWAPYNIRVNAVCPGFIETDMTEGLLSKEDLKKELISKIPLRRIGTPLDVANAVLFLVSPAASYITGHCLVVDGGWTAI